MSSRLQTKRLKTLRPLPLNDPLYTGGYRVGLTVFGKKGPTPPIPAVQKPETPGGKK